MKKRILAVLLTTVMTLSMAACGTSAPEKASAASGGSEKKSGEAIVLVMAEVNPLDTIVGMTDQKFKEEVEKRSGGSIKIDLQAGGVLGSENDVLDTMLGEGGTIQMSRISAFALTSYGGQKSMLLSLPYTFVNREHFWNFATSDLADEFLKEPSENGSGARANRIDQSLVARDRARRACQRRDGRLALSRRVVESSRLCSRRDRFARTESRSDRRDA